MTADNRTCRPYYEVFASYFPGYVCETLLDMTNLQYESGVLTRTGYMMAVRVAMGASPEWAAAWITAGRVYEATTPPLGTNTEVKG